MGGIGFQKDKVVLGDPAGRVVGVGAPAVFHQIGDTVDQHGGLAAARPRQQEERSLGGQGRPALFRIQVLELPLDDGPPGLTKSQFLVLIQHVFTYSLFLHFYFILLRGPGHARIWHGLHSVLECPGHKMRRGGPRRFRSLFRGSR